VGGSQKGGRYDPASVLIRRKGGNRQSEDDRHTHIALCRVSQGRLRIGTRLLFGTAPRRSKVYQLPLIGAAQHLTQYDLFAVNYPILDAA
jgi:hypothetical protein